MLCSGLRIDGGSNQGLRAALRVGFGSKWSNLNVIPIINVSYEAALNRSRTSDMQFLN